MARNAGRRAAARLRSLLRRERELWERGIARVAGVDEAGMGPLAGPVVAAAAIFPPGVGLRGVDDSKRLTAERREELAVQIRASAVAWSVVRLEPAEIDRYNIYHAGLIAMRRAVDALAVPPEHLLVDGRRIPGLTLPQERLIKGDATCHAIAAASILAKTERDRLMAGFEQEYPGYGFAEHKGYATAAHRAALRLLGPSPIHRRSFLLLPHPRLFD
ncbi:MAG TPA: ribonuclease HII [Candidatus Polarisedimenticolaceae bacterium]|nr:ribonuclease HII [Candidatus Polarisedimenticolaceae bacterium]